MGESTSVAFASSKAGWMIPTATGTLSALCSILVMITIFRSGSTRTTAYHLIIFFMSFWDTIASIAMTLTTAPMPDDVDDFYAFDGKSYGSKGTCEAQAFAIVLGGLFSCFSNTALTLFYVLTISFGMRDESFKKKILPVIFVLAIVVNVTVATRILSAGFLNPRPFEPYCLVGPYPMECKRDEANSIYECERGGAKSSKGAYMAITLPSIVLLFSFVIMGCSMFLVIATVFKTEMSNLMKGSQSCSEEGDEVGSSNSKFQETRVILRQALMYIGAFVVTWLWLLMLTFARGEGSAIFYDILDPLKVFFQPLQGFFNAWIFLSHKAYALRRSDRDMTFLTAIKKAIVSPYEVSETLITNIAIVEVDREQGFEEPEAGDPALSFPDLESNRTPSLDLSNVLSVTTKICNNDTLKKDKEDQHKNSRSYVFYNFPISASSTSNANEIILPN